MALDSKKARLKGAAGSTPPIGAMLKARRVEVGLTQEELSRKAEVPYTTLTKVESGAIKNPSMQVVQKLAQNLGLSLDASLSPRTFYGDNCLIEIFKDVLATMQTPGAFMCLSGIEEGRYLKENQGELLKFISGLKKQSINQKLLVCEGDLNFLEGDHLEYRWVKKQYFHPTPIYVYGDRIAMLIWDPVHQAIIVENKALAEAYRKQFLFIWDHSKLAPREAKKKVKK
jgi:transcriptional regulator with XRE-family HTH domain